MLKIGNIASIVAAIIIAILLTDIYGYGYTILFRGKALVLAVTLIIIGIVAGGSYAKSATIASKYMRRFAPIVLLLAILGVGLGTAVNETLGATFLIAAYFNEIMLAYPLYRELKSYENTGAMLFISGVSLFTLTLPLVLLTKRAAVVPLIGDIVKTIGLIILLAKMRKC
ncbi:hypothetical protein PYJP_18910 [Pyrofollis japonicus]|nr:hypothetical protein PYJP_18910 [Pyrofollis japonicus]